MRKRKLGLGLLFITMIMLVLLGCTKKTSVSLEKVENYEKVMLNLENYNGEENLLNFEAIVINNINYVNINNFIELCNKINDTTGVKRIEQLKIEDWNSEELKLIVKYRADNMFMATNINATRSVSGMIKGETKIEGENKEVVYDLSKLELKPVLIEEEIYIPIDIINFQILGADNYLARIDKNKYAIAQGEYIEKQGKISEGAYNEEYEISIKMLEEYLQDNFKLDEFSELKDEVDSYEDYMLKYNDMLNNLEDYHVNYSYKNRQADNESLDAIRKKSFKYMLGDELIKLGCNMEWEKEPIRYNKINDETMYLKINYFEVDSSEFFVDISKFSADYDKDDSIKKVVVDLRNNLGGNSYNVFLVMDKLITDEYKIKVGNLYNGEIFSTQEYVTKRGKTKEHDKEFIVLTNEASASASLILTYLMKENLNAEVIGREPIYKKATNLSCIQLVDGTLVSVSNPNYCFLTENNVKLEDAILVDKVMSDEEIEEYLNRE